jgi:hypothetical protein
MLRKLLKNGRRQCPAAAAEGHQHIRTGRLTQSSPTNEKRQENHRGTETQRRRKEADHGLLLCALWFASQLDGFAPARYEAGPALQNDVKLITTIWGIAA